MARAEGRAEFFWKNENRFARGRGPDRFAPVPSLVADSTDAPGRLDRWLWAVRVYKTRALATAACRAEHVEINGALAKPARHVRAEETVTVRQGLVTRTLLVRGVPTSRVGAKLVAEFCTETTPAAEWEKARVHRVQQVLARDKGAGRPTKRDRRQMDEFFGE